MEPKKISEWAILVLLGGAVGNATTSLRTDIWTSSKHYDYAEQIERRLDTLETRCITLELTCCE